MHDPSSTRLLSGSFPFYNTTMMWLERAYNIFKGLAGSYMESNDDPLSANQPNGGQENQEDPIRGRRGIQQQVEVEETDNAHVSEDTKLSSSRDEISLALCKSPIEVQKEARKPDARRLKAEHRQPTNTRHQSRNLADENASLKTKLEAERRETTKELRGLQGRIERLVDEKEEMLAKIKVERNESLRVKTAVENLAHENASLKTKLETEQRETTKELRGLQGRIETLVGEKEEMLARMKVERNESLRVKTAAENQIRDLQGKNQKLENELKMLQGKLHSVQEKNLHTAKLLEERSADLKGAQAFLTTADRYAGADILKMVEALNAEIFQGAAIISELLGDEPTTILKVDEQRKDAKDTRGAREFLIPYIGPDLVEHLSTKSEQVRVDPLPLQLAVQAILTGWCVAMVNSFNAGPTGVDLREIYERIWESEPQAVAGRWRSMTMGQAKHLDYTTHKDFVIRVLSTLLCVCGSPVANVNSPKTSLCLQQVVSTIMDMWMQLRVAILEGITTSEMEVFSFYPNGKYEDATMDDIYADTENDQQLGLGKEERHILCTVGLGLRRLVSKRNSDGTRFIQRDITLKVKVAFPSVLLDPA